jgi:hypothetical protein
VSFTAASFKEEGKVSDDEDEDEEVDANGGLEADELLSDPEL